MKLENIGFYTLSDNRAKTTSINSNLMRLEIILTDHCNLKCPYCRKLQKKLRGDISLPYIQEILQMCVNNNLVNVRFSGGEPTLYPFLNALVRGCKNAGIKRIAISTNGTASLKFYEELIYDGVNDFSISLDAGCCSIGQIMTGGNKNAWSQASKSIKHLSKLTYVTVGAVFNETNYPSALETIKYIDSLNPSDIRIISSAQYNKALDKLIDIPDDISRKYPIFHYRLNNYRIKRNIRGITKKDCHKCHLVLDDLAIAGNYHFPCIIYLRERGNPIGKMNENFRQERFEWFKRHNSYQDDICKQNCLDVCVDYNNKVEKFKIK